MKDQIPEFLQNKLNLKGYARTDCFPDEIKQFMLDYSKFYKWGLETNLKKILKVMKQNVTVLPICKYPGCNHNVKFDYYMKLTDGCSSEHNLKISMLEKYGVENPQQDRDIRNRTEETMLKSYGGIGAASKIIKSKMEETNLSKYNVKNTLSSPIIRNKIIETNLSKYGVSCPLSSPEIYNKSKKTLLLNYGVDVPLRSLEIRDKMIDTHRKKYGVDYFVQSKEYQTMQPEILMKQKLTNLNKFGYIYPMQSAQCKEQHKNTCLEKYGVNHPMQLPAIADKQQQSCYLYKEYIWKTGECSMLQGNEPIVLLELEKQGFKYGEILTDKKDMPIITYTFEGNIHRYYPDFYIPEENLIIEVKSDWTLKLHWAKNQAKFKAVKDAGYEFKLEVR